MATGYVQSVITAAGPALIVTAITACAPAPTQTPAATPTTTTQTRLGTLSFEKGFPIEDTTRKLFDEMDYQRAAQAYVWAYPAVSFESIRIGSKRDLDADLNDFVIADNYAGPKAVWLTANDTTIYSLTNVNLGKSGPLVIEIPPGAIVGILDDFWQRSLTDLGLPGPDGPNGRKFLLLPPGYKGHAPQTGYHVLQGTMNNYNVMIRGIVQNNDKDAAVANVRRVRVYPLSESANPTPNRFFSMSGKDSNTLPPKGIAFWEHLSTFINNNPVHERDMFSWACSSRSASRRARRSSPTRGNARFSKRQLRSAMPWAARCCLTDPIDSVRSGKVSESSRFPERSGIGCSRSIPSSKPIPTARSMNGCTTPTVRSTRRPRWA